MHIWSMKLLADELRNNKLTELQCFRYLLVLALLGGTSWAFAWIFGMGTALATIPFGFVFPVLCVGILAVGLTACFRAFQQRNGAQFIPKFVCLLLPANIRMIALYVPLSAIASFAVFVVPSEQRQSAMTIANAAVVTMLMALQFVLVYRHLVNRQGTASADGEMAA